jgi:sugar lactone lactonase YvrE
VFTQAWYHRNQATGGIRNFDVVRVMSLNTSVGSLGDVKVLAGFENPSGIFFESDQYVNQWDGTTVIFNKPAGITFSPDGSSILVCDKQHNRIRTLPVSQYDLHDDFRLGVSAIWGSDLPPASTLAGSDFGFKDGAASLAQFASPEGAAFSRDGTIVYVADTMNHRIRLIDKMDMNVSTLAGSGVAGTADGVGSEASFNSPSDVAVTPDGLKLLVIDRLSQAIRTIVISTGTVTTLFRTSSNGASASYPNGIAISPDGSTALFSDTINQQIRAVDINSGHVTVLAGSPLGSASFADGPGSSAAFHDPRGIAISPDGKFALVADTNNSMIRKITFVEAR